MKIIAKMRAFYNDRIIKVGEIIDIKRENCPDWAEPVNKSAKEDKPEIPKADEVTTHPEPLPQRDEGNTPSNKYAGKSPEELEKILEDLQNKGLEINYMVDDTENKTVLAQIEELEQAIAKAAKEDK